MDGRCVSGTRGNSSFQIGLRLERIQKTRALLIGNLDGFPVEKVGGFFALDFAHEAAAGVGAGIDGQMPADELARKSADTGQIATESREQFGRTDCRRGWHPEDEG